MARKFGVLAGSALGMAVLIAPSAATAVAVRTFDPVAVPVTDIVDVSANGRIVLAKLAGRWVVYDLASSKVKRRLPTTGDPEDGGYDYVDLSGAGKVVAFASGKKVSGCRINVPQVRYVASNRVRNVATNAKGKQLLPTWVNAGNCPDQINDSPFGVPAISDNGRYVAYCGDPLVHGREDLFVKDLKNGKLTRTDGVCGASTGDGEWYLNIPQISETGAVVLLEGNRGEVNGDEQVWWDTSKLVVRGRGLIPGPGSWYGYTLVPDGSAVFVNGGAACSEAAAAAGQCPGGPPARFDVATSALAPVAPGDPGPDPTTRHGRYVLGAPGDSLNHKSIYDRQTGVTTPLPGDVRWQLLSSDGKWVIGETAAAWPLGTGKWYRLALEPAA